MGQPIVVGLDGSAQSLAAAEWACREARPRGHPVELLQAWPRRGLGHPFATSAAEVDMRTRKALREAGIETAARHEGIEISTLRVPGHPAEVLTAAGRRAEMLVLGSRGLGTVAGFLLGSTSQTVLAHAACPVVLVRHAPQTPGDDQAGRSGARDVVLGLDIRRPCEELLAFAFETATTRGARLRVVHVRRPMEEFGYAAAPLPASLSAELDAEERQAVQALLGPWRRKYPQLDVELETRTGSPARELVDALPPADLLVVGRHARHAGPGFHMGPVTHGAVHHAGCPVAVVPFS
jgi:nucleotide-binding universal stress UspA family protein